MNSPRLSIVTVVHNSLPLLQATIASLNAQSELSFEYVIIDGDSSDGTREFVLRCPEPASKVLSEPDAGIYSAMNKAPALCSGEYIQYLNAGDTLFNSNTIAAVLPHLDGRNDLVIFNYLINGERYKPVLSLRGLLGGTPCHQAIFYRREYLLKHLFDTRLKYCADFYHLLNALADQSILIAEPVVINYDTTGISSNPRALRRIRLERAWSAWHSNLNKVWRLTITGYNFLRSIR